MILQYYTLLSVTIGGNCLRGGPQDRTMAYIHNLNPVSESWSTPGSEQTSSTLVLPFLLHPIHPIPPSPTTSMYSRVEFA